jgi:hypothetical protein
MENGVITMANAATVEVRDFEKKDPVLNVSEEAKINSQKNGDKVNAEEFNREISVSTELDSVAENMKSLSMDNLLNIIKDIRRTKAAR